jgi:uncharacterized protein YkwD
LRKLAIALLAVPILSVLYVSTALRRSPLVRIGSTVGLGMVVALGVIVVGRPIPAAATAPLADVPLPAAAFRTVLATDRDLAEPVTIEFSVPMDEASVSSALSVTPATPVTLAWDPAGTVLTVSPKGHWAAGTYHTVTVDAGALAASGAPMASPARAAFLTRDAAAAEIAATLPAGKRIGIGSAFTITFDRAVDPATVATAFSIVPATPGTLAPTVSTATTGPASAAAATAGASWTFTPAQPLIPNTRYRLTLDGVLDADGVAVPAATLSVRTGVSPGVIRFRPRADTADVARGATLSVRFTQPMDEASTTAAFTVRAGSAPVAGKVAFAEDDTVLVFEPTKALPYGTKVVMTVATTARSRDGAPLGAAAKGTFRTVAKPTAKRASGGGSSGGSTGGGGGGGGGAVGGGSWASVETYYLGLMNCTRTGGWVTSSGSCSSPGGRGVAPLRLDSGISSRVSRPYAKKLAVGGDCSHFIGGNPGNRLAAAGYTNYTWAENLGCRSGDPRAAVLGSHLFFQNEKSTNGGHYVNLMNSKYDRVGIGVWVSGGRVRLVIDFYHP